MIQMNGKESENPIQSLPRIGMPNPNPNPNPNPSHYNLTLLPSLETLRFSGHVSISMTVREGTKLICLHAKKVQVTCASVVGFRFPNGMEDGRVWPNESVLNLPKQVCSLISHQEEDETVTLIFEHEIPSSSNIVLHVEFEGILSDEMDGFYRSSYTDSDGNEKHLLCTHFEPSGARKAFPCFDDPNLKATFDVTLYVPSGLVGLSNMNVMEEKETVLADQKQYTAVKFTRTPIMPTHLLAFYVGKAEYEKQFLINHPKLIES